MVRLDVASFGPMWPSINAGFSLWKEANSTLARGSQSSSPMALFGCFGRGLRAAAKEKYPPSGGYFVVKLRHKHSGECDCYICYNFGCSGSQIGSVTASDVLFPTETTPGTG